MSRASERVIAILQEEGVSVEAQDSIISFVESKLAVPDPRPWDCDGL